MPEIKNQFTGGKMNKDLDERLVPKGDYRDAMNIQVSTSEEDAVGTVQNILGNQKIGNISIDDGFVVGCIADEKIDTLYYLVWSQQVDYIFSYKRGDNNVKFIFRDSNKNVLKFDPNNVITGINVIDGMLFWTDNKNEPKKINIARCEAGTPGFNLTNHTKLINEPSGLTNLGLGSVDIEEKHITVIKKTPVKPLELKLNTSRHPSKVYTAVVYTNVDDGSAGAPLDNSFADPSNFNFSGFAVDDEFTIKLEYGIDSSGASVAWPASNGISNTTGGLTGWQSTSPAFLSAAGSQGTIPAGTKIVFKAFDEDGDPPGLPVSDYSIKGIVVDAYPSTNNTTYMEAIKVKVVSVDGFPTLPEPGQVLNYVVDLFDETEKLFEFKFPRFSYRYKYEDGEYSPFAPFTQIAFLPGSFDYHPRKGYNLGMTNKLTKVELGGFIYEDMPEDVVSVDILFKDEPSSNIYIVDTIRPNDANPTGVGSNVWDEVKNGGYYSINSEAVNGVIPSNQLLRPWDNVPKKALAQDITGNRIVYGNYIQNYNLDTVSGEKYFATFDPKLVEYSETGMTGAGKSIKSLREYQLGVVFIDKYGRETPVISNPTGTLQVEKDKANKNNRFKCKLTGQDVPRDLTYYKFFVKETSNEYYNMAMDRWYDAEDGNIWLAFPSSDRNKIDIDTFLILKKGTDSDDLVADAARYKVLAIESEAPDYIKTSKILMFTKDHAGGGAGGVTDIFGGSTVDTPMVGDTEFKMNFICFHGTSGQNLDAIEEDLYIQFGKSTNSQLSKRYRISSITNDWDVTQPGLVNIDNDPAQYSVKLEEALGEDVNFITDNPGNPLNSTKIDDGARVRIYKYKVENKPQFDGRFFVKIHKDEVFKNNISKSFAGDLEYRVGEFRKLFGIKDDHIARHTSDVRNFLVNDFECEGGGNNWDEAGNPTRMADWMFGYYLDHEFSSFALYFRRYQKMNDLRGQDENSASFTAGWFSGYPSGTPIPVEHPLASSDYCTIMHLEPGGNDVTYDDQHTGTTHWQRLGTGEIKGYTARWQQARERSDVRGVGGTNDDGFKSQMGHSWIESGNTSLDHPNDTSVWFVDMGPSKTTGTSLAQGLELKWAVNADHPSYPAGQAWSLYGYSDYGDGQVNIDSSDNPINRVGGGINIDNANDKWEMEIGFGGIERADPVQQTLLGDFFNVGDWNTSGSLGSNLNHSSENAFVSNINTGIKFKFKEDFDEKIYTILGSPEQIDCIRHSHFNHKYDGDNHSGSFTDDGRVIPFTFNEDRPYMSSLYNVVGATNQFGSWWSGGSTQLLINRNVRGHCKAEALSFNFTKNWNIKNIQPALEFDITADGIIPNSKEIKIPAIEVNGSTCDGTSFTDDLKIYVTDIKDSSNSALSLYVGMALWKYTRASNNTEDTLENHLPSIPSTPISASATPNEFLVIRGINQYSTHHELILGGYRKHMRTLTDHKLASTHKPKAGANYTFVQVGLNGYSPNSEFNINTMGEDMGCGKVGAVGYTMQFIEEVEPEEILSDNPAIFETEPKDAKDLDIYYEATGAIPIEFNEDNIHEAFPIGSKIGSDATIIGYDGTDVKVDNASGLAPGPSFYVKRPDKLELNVIINNVDLSNNLVTIHPFLYNGEHKLDWHNCYSFGNGVESNRIRDNYNLPYISNGVKVSTTLEGEYQEEHRKYGLIYSGLYNSVSGVNNLNQFIQAEKITKDINPIYGSIQKLHSRDSDLVTLCEDKCLRILANKDAVFNAGGNTNLTATENVLGQTIPFSGEYGISTNPESFASESYRTYFTDKVRGAVIRLSKDGITPISNYGMKDWFRDNLKLAKRIIGSHDDKKGEYNITLKHYPNVKILGASKTVPPTLPYEPTNKVILTPQQAQGLNVGDAFVANGIPNGTVVLNKTVLSPLEVQITLDLPLGLIIDVSTYGQYKPYGSPGSGQVFWSTTLYMDNFEENDKTISFKEKSKGWVSFKSFTPENALSMANDYYTFKSGNIYKHHIENLDRNTFYNIFEDSSVTVVLNSNPSVIKSFNTLNYEGSQSKIDQFIDPTLGTLNLPFQPSTTYSDQDVYNLSSKLGWYVDKIITDKEEGNVKEFVEREGKWFNNINRVVDILSFKADTADFTFQGIGEVSSAVLSTTTTTGVPTGTGTGTGTGTTGTTGTTSTTTTVTTGITGVVTTAVTGGVTPVLGTGTTTGATTTGSTTTGGTITGGVVTSGVTATTTAADTSGPPTAPPCPVPIVALTPTTTSGNTNILSPNQFIFDIPIPYGLNPWVSFEYEVTGPNGYVATSVMQYGSGVMMNNTNNPGGGDFILISENEILQAGTGIWELEITFTFTNGTSCTSVVDYYAEVGCTNSSALNYNPDAIVDDGSCQLPIVTPRSSSPKLSPKTTNY